jgi:hypothetical protein
VNTIVNYIIEDINKERNKRSNPSIFFKFIGLNNLDVLNENLLNELVNVLRKRINIYISCDKNILFLFLKVIKVCSGISSNQERNYDKSKRYLKDRIRKFDSNKRQNIFNF